MKRILRYTIAAIMGAVIAWAVMEWTPLMPDDDRAVSYAAIFVIGLVSGFLIGLALGLAEAASGLSPRDAVKGIIGGALFGAGGGILGLTFGNAFYNIMFRLAGAGAPQQLPGNLPPEAVVPAVPGIVSFILLLIGRGFGWALIGCFIGLSQGVATSSAKKMVNGAVGGFIGGGAGGSVFEILVWLNKGGVANFTPPMVRFISFAITGAAIGLFIGFVEEIAKQAWLIRLVGRNEGKEYSIYKPITILGRSELVDIPIFADPDVVERHAAIAQDGGRYTVEDMGSFFGTTVNGQKVTKERLRDGDTIQVGKTRFLFRDKATARLTQGTTAACDRIPTSQHVCPFCGSVKDANGNCDCTVGSPSAPPGAEPTVQSAAARVQAEATIPQTASPTTAGARLTAMSGPYAGRTFPLKSGETIIGREVGKDISLAMDNTVSRDHARIAQEVTCHAIYDLGSTNGTFVNGAKITHHELKPGDLVQIGSTKFKFEA